MAQQQFATLEELQAVKASITEQYDSLRKLVNAQAVAIDRKLQILSQSVSAFISRKPDPNLIRDAWIQRLPRIQEELKALQMEVAKMKSIREAVVRGGQ